MKEALNFLILAFYVFPMIFSAPSSKFNFEDITNDKDNDGFVKVLDAKLWDQEQFEENSSDLLNKNSSISDSEANALSNLLNCEKIHLNSIDESSLKRLNVEYLGTLSKIQILHEIYKIDDIILFELYAEKNLTNILSEIRTSLNFHLLIICCVRAKSFKTFLLLIDNQAFPINVPRTLAIAAKKGSKEILEYIIANSSNSKLKMTWDYKTVQDEDGYMLHLGPNIFDASLSLAASEAIKANQFDCFSFLLSLRLNFSYQDFWLLKEIVYCTDSRIFDLILSDDSVPKSILKEILVLAIKRKNILLIEHLIKLDVNLDSYKTSKRLNYKPSNSNDIFAPDFKNFDDETSYEQLGVVDNCDEFSEDLKNICSIC